MTLSDIPSQPSPDGSIASSIHIAAAAVTSDPTRSVGRGQARAGPGAGPAAPAAGAAASANKRSAPPDDDGSVASPASTRETSSSQVPEYADGDSTKKRRTGPGSRGVANLTPEQLAKKRANDREAQRAIRERTKNQIETLERRIRELTSQQPYQELQAVLRAKEAVEAENAEIKRKLASVIALLQPLAGSAPVQGPESSYASPDPSYYHAHPNPSHVPANNASTPTSIPSPAPVDSQYGPGDHSPQQTQSNSALAQKLLCQQRHDLRHSLDLGPERLGLDFLLDPTQRIAKIQNGINGAQDTPQYHHVSMKHDWTGINASRSQPNGTAGSRQLDYPPDLGPPIHKQQQQQQQQQRDLDLPPSSGPTSAPIRNGPPTCPLDALLLDFLDERRQRAAEGLSTQEIIGPRYPSVSSLLNPANSAYSHPLSKVFTDILSTFPDLSALPERVAVLYIMFLIMRWQISPTPENHARLPEWVRPHPVQLLIPHPAWIDHVPFPVMREKLVREYNPRDYLFDNFFVPFTNTLCLNWPYEDIDTLLQSPDSDELMINPVFERHLRRLENWTLGDAFANTFPSLKGTFNLKPDVPSNRRTKVQGPMLI